MDDLCGSFSLDRCNYTTKVLRTTLNLVHCVLTHRVPLDHWSVCDIYDVIAADAFKYVYPMWCIRFYTNVVHTECSQTLEQCSAGTDLLTK